MYTFLLALFAIFQFFSSHGLIYWMVISPGWTFGPYVNHNHYAGLMEMLIPLTVASFCRRFAGNASAAVLLGFVALIPIASLLLSGSRGGFISLMVEVAAGRRGDFLVWIPARRAKQRLWWGGQRSLPPRSCSSGWRRAKSPSAWRGWGTAHSHRKWNWANGWSSPETRLGFSAIIPG